MGKFKFIEGPLFTNILLVDEINRASSRTQSALLEAMNNKKDKVQEILNTNNHKEGNLRSRASRQ